MIYDNTVANIMTSKVVTVNKYTLLEDVFELFKAHRFHHLPVVNNDNTLIGIISTTDLATVFDPLIAFNRAKSWQETHRYMRSMTAADIMEEEVTVLHPEHKISVAYEIFKDNQFHAIPIVKDKELVGILTTYDLLKFAYSTPNLIKEMP